MNQLMNNLSNCFFNTSNSSDLDINKILIILLLLTDRLNIEAIHIYKNNFVISLGTFREE